MPLCPYCYRTEGIFAHDPILLPSGAKYDWDLGTPNTLIAMDIGDRWYQGFQQISEIDVVELQTILHDLEEDNLPEEERTEFSPVNDSGIFQVKGLHIKEMRESVEKLLEVMGTSKVEFFNYDEEGNHIIHPLGDKIDWTDPVDNEEDWDKFQVKAIHIEDLRHYLPSTITWEETWGGGSYSRSHTINGPSINETYSDVNASFIITGSSGISWESIVQDDFTLSTGPMYITPPATPFYTETLSASVSGGLIHFLTHFKGLSNLHTNVTHISYGDIIYHFDLIDHPWYVTDGSKLTVDYGTILPGIVYPKIVIFFEGGGWVEATTTTIDFSLAGFSAKRVSSIRITNQSFSYLIMAQNQTVVGQLDDHYYYPEGVITDQNNYVQLPIIRMTKLNHSSI